MFLVVTTRSEPMTIAAARIPNATCWATISQTSLLWSLDHRFGGWAATKHRGVGGRSLLGALLDLGAGLQGRGLGHGDHPLVEAGLVVQQVGDIRFAVFELGR